MNHLRLAIIAAAALFAPAVARAAAPIFSSPSITVAENAGSATFTILKSAKAASYSKILVQTVDGTAKAGIDYQPVKVTLTFGNSATKATVPIPIIDNSTFQGSRTFSVRITVVRFAALPAGYQPATVTITDNEAPADATWKFCAVENDSCNIVGTANVRYGALDKWFVRSITTGTQCTNSIFGDPIPGTVKRCETDGALLNPPTTTPPPPTTASACKALTMVDAEHQLPYADMLCTAVRTCQDYRIGLVPFAGQPPIVQQGQRYYVVRGLIWPALDDQHVVAWPAYGLTADFGGGYPGGAFFDRSCFE